MEISGRKRILNRYITAIWFFVTTLIVVFAISEYYSKLKYEFKNEITNSLGELSSQSVIALNKQIQGEINTMRDLSEVIGNAITYDPQRIIKHMVPTVERNNFKRVGIANKEGKAYTTDGYELDLSNNEVFLNSMKGETNISESFIDNIDKEFINVYSTPIYRNKKIEGMLFATRATDIYMDTIAVSTFKGKGYTYVIKSNGDSVVGSSNINSIKEFDNIIDILLEQDKRNKEVAMVLEEGLNNNESGYINYYYKNLQKYMYYKPLEINDWYLLTIVPSDVLEEKMEIVMNKTYVLGATLIIVIFILMLLIYGMQSRSKRDLEKIAYVDAVTGGYSYIKFQHKVESILRKQNIKGALISIDVDKFKYLNDIFGYREGNNAIRFIWQVLKKISQGDDVFAHRSADNFVLFLCYEEQEVLYEKLNKICKEIKGFTIRGKKRYELILSMGIYETYNGILSIDSMIDRAQIAQSMIKGKHNEYYMFYDKEIRDKQIRDKEIENNMTNALENKEYVIFYQPKYRVTDKVVTGSEALVRWKRKDGTLIPPLEFIPLFESNGFITTLDKYVFTEVCKNIRKWLDNGIQPVPVSVNLSRLHLYNPSFIEEYKKIMDKYTVPSKYIQLEVTETTMFEDIDVLLNIIDRLHEEGFQILMDDFGTGYSSLNMLNDIPIDVIKLDKGFVNGIGDTRSEKIIISIIRLAQALNIEVTAEGVENERQYEFLKSVHCDTIQGYYFSKPVAEEEYEKILLN